MLGDFYKIPVTVAFLIASIIAIAIGRGKLNDRILRFSTGASDRNIMLMVWIFVMAGAFGQSARAIGAIDATVNLTLSVLPSNWILVGIFIASCFVSLAMGTSVGTIVALAPIAAGIAERMGSNPAMVAAIVVGGAFFGDNLSFISDTTIAATQTMGCKMNEKFKANIMIALPAAIVSSIIYFFASENIGNYVETTNIEWFKVFPYILVIALSIIGLNVMIVLLCGIMSSCIIGLFTGTDIWTFIGSMGTGIVGMGELIIMTLLAGGLLEMIRYGGGISYIISTFENLVKGKRGAEFVIAMLVGICNFCTANNTIAIITVGPIARDIANKFGVNHRRAASILDTFSCFVQSVIPYGAQMLMASALTSQAPIAIITHLYYPFILLTIALISIIIGRK